MAGTTLVTLLEDTFVLTGSSICPFRLTNSHFIRLLLMVPNSPLFACQMPLSKGLFIWIYLNVSYRSQVHIVALSLLDDVEVRYNKCNN